MEKEERKHASLVTFSAIVFSGGVRGVINNHSDAPIYDVRMILEQRTASNIGRPMVKFSKIGSISTNGTHTVPAPPEILSIADSVASDEKKEYQKETPGLICGEDYIIRLIFQDTNSVHWERHGDDGSLKKLGEPGDISRFDVAKLRITLLAQRIFFRK
ncbi:hypothetical protein [Rhodococcus sp. LW-XY12]|uniref:hypothetical protein n=1 Tax=Rhodococcus sp. LW-XY12 TaxID=2856851 RepID=UPI001C57CF86|nr:hypothetical protein [Rhodococcus sp. LW-XY12]QXU52196.1 hypothetical protein KXC42_15010 [Rhodococcus sp. LW-XY12]